MSEHSRRITRAGYDVLIADSVTGLPAEAHGSVGVCGSHGGMNALLIAASTGLKAVLVNDAGLGKEGAGVAGVHAAVDWGLAAAAVSCHSARIGDGEDTYASGIISYANELALGVGVRPGMATMAAAEILQTWQAPACRAIPPRPLGVSALFVPSSPRVLGVDSASDIGAECRDSIVVCGSHGGLVGGAALSEAVFAVFFNDAGVGKQEAGILRLATLDRIGVASGTVGHDTARIGDALDSLESGRLSHINRTAAAAGIVLGMGVPEAAALLVSWSVGGCSKWKEHLES